MLDNEQKSVYETSEVRHCDKHGDYQARVAFVKMGSFSLATSCPECNAERKKERVEAELEGAKFEHMIQMGKAGMYERYFNCTFDNYITKDPQTEEHLKALRNYVDTFERTTSTNIVMHGVTGAGKTHLASAVVKNLIRKKISVKYLPVLNLISSFHDLSKTRYETATDDFFLRLTQPDMLVIDEFGITNLTGEEQVMMHRIIDARYSRLAPIMLIGNISLSDMEEMIGERAMRRVMQGAKIMQFRTESALEVGHA